MIRDHMNIWLLRPGVGGFGDLPTLLDDTDKRGGAEQFGERWDRLGMLGGSKGQRFTVLVAPSSCSVRSGFGPQTNSSWSSRTASSRLFSLIGRLRLAGFISKSHGSNCLTIPRRAWWWETRHDAILPRTASTTPGEPHCAKSRPRSSWSFAASITASCRRGRKCDGAARVRFRSPSPGQGKACGSITRPAAAATSSSSSRSSAAARLSTLSTMRRNTYPNCETDIIRRGRHHGRRHGRQLTTTATTRSASSRRSRSGAKPGRCAARWPSGICARAASRCQPRRSRFSDFIRAVPGGSERARQWSR